MLLLVRKLQVRVQVPIIGSVAALSNRVEGAICSTQQTSGAGSRAPMTHGQAKVPTFLCLQVRRNAREKKRGPNIVPISQEPFYNTTSREFFNCAQWWLWTFYAHRYYLQSKLLMHPKSSWKTLLWKQHSQRGNNEVLSIETALESDSRLVHVSPCFSNCQFNTPRFFLKCSRFLYCAGLPANESSARKFLAQPE